MQRTDLWGSLGLGLQYNAFTYNVYGVSVLTYIAQLEKPPFELKDTEKQALRKAASGPGNWISPQDCWYLQQCSGQARSLASIQHVAWAAQVRTATWEDNILQRARDLKRLQHETIVIGRCATW